MTETTKQCIRCSLHKELSKFKTKKRIKKTTGLVVYDIQNICKLCNSRLYRSKPYTGELANPSGTRLVKSVKTRRTNIEIKGKYIKRNKEFIKAYLSQSKCCDCGIADWRVLEFDHLPQYTKHKNISEIMGKGNSLMLLEAEIAKCEVVCSNCHTIRSFTRGGSWRLND